MLNFDYDHVNSPPNVKDKKARELYSVIRDKFSTLAWCRKWLEEFSPKHFGPLKNLTDNHIVKGYPPLSDIKGCYTA